MTAEAGSEQLASLQTKLPGYKLSGGSLTKTVSTSDPDEAIREVKALGDAIRKLGKPEGLK